MIQISYDYETCHNVCVCIYIYIYIKTVYFSNSSQKQMEHSAAKNKENPRHNQLCNPYRCQTIQYY